MTNDSMKNPRLLLAAMITAYSAGAFVAPAALAWEAKVERGDTLMAIAMRTRESDTTTAEQQALAIFTLNPGAFAKKNVNGRRHGSSLRIPNREQAEVIQSSEADLTIRQHHTDWNRGVVVKRGDTLMKIAAQTRESDSTTVDQQALALLELNPRAFSKRNINGLRSGTKLRIPSKDAAESVDSESATKIIAEQNRYWHRSTAGSSLARSNASDASNTSTSTSAAKSSKSAVASRARAPQQKAARTDVAKPVTIIRGSQIEVTRVRH